MAHGESTPVRSRTSIFTTRSGPLPFAVTALGFYLVGTKPFAFVVGECIVAAVIAVLAVVAVKDRLALIPGDLFVALCAMLALAPVTIGDLATAYTFAMAYNRFGWSLLGILYLVLFVEPRDVGHSGLPDIIVARSSSSRSTI